MVCVDVVLYVFGTRSCILPKDGGGLGSVDLGFLGAGAMVKVVLETESGCGVFY